VKAIEPGCVHLANESIEADTVILAAARGRDAGLRRQDDANARPPVAASRSNCAR
jgi:hypothetical protein